MSLRKSVCVVCGGGGGGGDGVVVVVGGLNTQRCWNGNTKELVSYELWRETHFTDMV